MSMKVYAEYLKEYFNILGDRVVFFFVESEMRKSISISYTVCVLKMQ